ncbi:hypothetical protein IF188_09665 [Microbacterium sp. NEAU-LLC]|uniref:Uncharacterized protein n=1 Tax=Microbacterium helvum TaxID=2773713 RepID=A0ABR8NQW3_9MICO|nr:hypothetical protein [Microbacterium helvum]MBD3941961.1 hypothetical protein [Microbacterium helvum]
MTIELVTAELVVPAERLKMLRETLCRAQSALRVTEGWVDDAQSSETDAQAMERFVKLMYDIDQIAELVREIDRHRPLGIDGKHGDLHTPTCGCGDR